MEEMEVNQGDGRPPLFKAAFEGAVIITAVSIILTMILYLLNLHTNQWLGYVSLVVIFLILFVVAKNYRNKGGRNALSYGKAFKFLFFTILFVTLLSSVFNYIYFTWIAPEVIDYALDQAVDQMLDRGMSEEQVQQQMKYQMPWMTNYTFTAFAGVAVLFWGTIASLIMAAIVKRDSKSI